MMQNRGRYTVVVTFDNPDLKLRPYTRANIQSRPKAAHNVLRVPMRSGVDTPTRQVAPDARDAAQAAEGRGPTPASG